MLIQTDYKSVRCRIRPGDIIAFSGSGRISRLIQFFTRSVVSHVGIVFEIMERDVRRVKLMESTTLDGLQGVQETYLSERIQTYSGPVWWLPLSEKVRSQMDQGRFWKALFDANGRPYDYRQVLHHGIDWLRLRSQGESPGRLYCSELCALALKSGYAGSIAPKSGRMTFVLSGFTPTTITSCAASRRKSGDTIQKIRCCGEIESPA
jgi:hypothetical protein